MSHYFTIGGVQYYLFVDSIVKELKPRIFVLNPVNSDDTGTKQNITVNYTGTPSQTITIKGRSLIGAAATNSSSGPRSPTVSGSVPHSLNLPSSWTSPNNIFSADGVYASSVYPGAARGPFFIYDTPYLTAKTFGFALGSTTTVNGVVAEVKCRELQHIGAIMNVNLISGSTVIGTDQELGQVMPLTNTYLSWGSSTNKWGYNLLYSDINATTFGFGITCRYLGPAANIQIDHMRMTVYYTTYATGYNAVDVFDKAIRDGNQIAFNDDEGGIYCFIVGMKAGRIQTQSTNKYLDLEIQLVKSG